MNFRFKISIKHHEILELQWCLEVLQSFPRDKNKIPTNNENQIGIRFITSTTESWKPGGSYLQGSQFDLEIYTQANYKSSEKADFFLSWGLYPGWQWLPRPLRLLLFQGLMSPFQRNLLCHQSKVGTISTKTFFILLTCFIFLTALSTS